MAVGQFLKDKTIANQAESIVNLTRSLAKIVGSGLPAKNKARRFEASV